MPNAPPTASRTPATISPPMTRLPAFPALQARCLDRFVDIAAALRFALRRFRSLYVRCAPEVQLRTGLVLVNARDPPCVPGAEGDVVRARPCRKPGRLTPPAEQCDRYRTGPPG
ncbi:hypothetical protein GCM10007977_001130 [Dactylosporangium sucinum]|uniref:Uncharacterized protein n=1 Tax=Dactylosporangium sucinum TaxID=1424081 RepID=A0A917SY77_9ACTN|nr:hypothetical protein GCM10007977_001130 [Dactylosporangium sucinum]